MWQRERNTHPRGEGGWEERKTGYCEAEHPNTLVILSFTINETEPQK